jgi:mitogen-activated protein kinase 1/3
MIRTHLLLLLQVALKRIPDVLLNSENAKRVLREVCILRRLEHPHIIGLKDVFLKPSSTGRWVGL